MRGVVLKNGVDNEKAEDRYNECCCLETTIFVWSLILPFEAGVRIP